jgi:hypothetical protein
MSMRQPSLVMEWKPLDVEPSLIVTPQKSRGVTDPTHLRPLAQMPIRRGWLFGPFQSLLDSLPHFRLSVKQELNIESSRHPTFTASSVTKFAAQEKKKKNTFLLLPDILPFHSL